MADFKSEPIDAVSSYSYIPTGGIVTLAGPFSEYSDASYPSLGLIPCDGRLLKVSEYPNLYPVISNYYGGVPYPDGLTQTYTLTGSLNGPGSLVNDEFDNFLYSTAQYVISNPDNLYTLNTVAPPAYPAISIDYIDSNFVSLSFSVPNYPSQVTITLINCFKVPNLKDNKMTIVGTSNTFYNTNTVGTKLTSYNHSHSVSMSNNDFFMNAANVTHSHNFNWSNLGDRVDNGHEHARVLSAGTMGGSQKNGPAGTAGGALIGNHVHNFGVSSPNNFANVSGGPLHNHSGSKNVNSGNAGDASHTHSSSATSANTSSSNTVSGTVSNPLAVPYANVLYFIKA